MSETEVSIVDNRIRLGILSEIYSTLFSSRLSKIGVGIIVGVLVLILIGSLVTPYSPYAASGAVDKSPSYEHIFGTDYLGHDLFSQIVWGAYPSLFVAIGGALGSVALGFFVGVFGGYYGKLEGILGGASDVVMAFPVLPLLIMLGSLFPATNLFIMSLLIVVLWPPVARSVRAQVATAKKLLFVDSARTGGLGDIEIVGKIIVPEVGSIAIAYFIVNVSLTIVLTTALQFLGVGNPDAVSWGSILYWAQQFGFYAGAWWWILAPGAIITITATGFAFIGFALEERFNPRLRII